MDGIRAVLLDFGHTLVEWGVDRESLLESYRDVHEFLAEHGIHPRPVPPDLMLHVTQRIADVVTASYERREIEELDALSLFDDAFRHLGLPVEPALLEQVMELEHERFARHLMVSDATVATLGELRRRGLRLGLVSNTINAPRLMHQDLELLGLAPLLDVAVFSSEVGVRKPDPRIYRAVLDRLEVEPASALFVGDRLREDVQGPRALGMRAVLTQEFRQEEPGAVQPDAVIARFPELLDVLDGRAP